jgi:NAD(P)-dependent dehydrogenase (short-subunit alcohol dehydrogenase family)
LDISHAPVTLASNPEFGFFQCDLANSNVLAEAVEAARTAFGGRIDGLLNVAGIMDNESSVDTLMDEDWDRVIAVNLTAPVKLMRAVVHIMKAQGGGGSIVNISSKAGTSGASAGVAYTSSKHGLVSGFVTSQCRNMKR